MKYSNLGLFIENKGLIDRQLLGRQKISPEIRNLVKSQKSHIDIYKTISQAPSFTHGAIVNRYIDDERISAFICIPMHTLSKIKNH